MNETVREYLISNDDGVLAPGLAALVDAVSSLGTYHVVAPRSNCSGYSNALTLDRPLRLATLANGHIAVEGTPVDCVHLAINGLLDKDPDMVVSGINAGANLGDDVLYSGTVAAAIEGRFLGKPAIALSLDSADEASDYRAAGQVAARLLKRWDQLPLPKRSILNVNIPKLPYDALRGYQVTRLGHRKRARDVQVYTDPRGREGYWIGLASGGEDAGPGTDFHAIQEGYVSITPLQVDMTRYDGMDELRHWLEDV